MPKVRQPPPPPESYTVAIEPNLLEIVLESALKAATRPLYEEMKNLRQDIRRLSAEHSALVEVVEQMQHNHTQQLQQLANSLRELQGDVDDAPDA